MNPEQEVLTEIVAMNPVLRLLAHLLAKEPDHDEVDLLQVASKDKTGLSEAQSAKIFDWLIRKGFFRQLTEEKYPRVKARYSFNAELKKKAMDWNCASFGSVGARMLQSTAERFNLPSSSGGNVILWTWPDGNILDHHGRLIGREEAVEVRQALAQYLKKHEAMTQEEFEKHRESHENFLWWGSLLDRHRSPIRELRYSGAVARYLSPAICNCNQCTEWHQLAFTTLTNYFNYEKQEKKQIRSALKALA
jgi:hypothetical protein